MVYLSRAHHVSVIRTGIAVRSRPEQQEPFASTAIPSFLPELDGVNQVVGGVRMTPMLRSARDLWVVAASAPYGYGAARSGQPYACWLATGLESEWASRRPSLRGSRRLAFALNRPVLKRLERTVVERASLVFGISPASCDTIAESAGVPRERVRELPIPVDLDELKPAPDAEWLAALDEPRIVFIGRVADARKNLRLLYDALPAIRARIPSARLTVVGHPPPRHVPDGVDAVGGVASVAEPLRHAALFVLPSLQEGFGIVVAEAFACGVPVVVTPCGGPEHLVRASGGGRVLETFGADELAETVVELLGSRERLLELRRRGRAYVEREHAPERLQQLLGEAFEEMRALG